MKQLLSIEFTKLKRLTSLKVILMIYMLMVPAWMFFLSYFYHAIIDPIFRIHRNIWAFPEIWNFSTFAASFFNLLMGVTVVIIICNEYTFRTIKQNVIDGMTKKEVIMSKFLVVFTLATIVTLYTALVALIFGLVNGGIDEIYRNCHYIFIYYLQALGYFSFAFFFAILVKRPALAIIFFIVSFIAEWIVGIIITLNVSKTIYNYFPLNVFSKLTPNPLSAELEKVAKMQGGQVFPDLSMSTNILLSLLYLSLFFVLSYLILKRKDI